MNSHKMRLEILNVSIVILAQNHNPSLLHPAFLSLHNIVPADWQTIEPPISTPILSIIKFNNGFVFSCDPTKLQIVYDSADVNAHVPQLVDISKKLLKSFQPIQSTAVGVNILGLIESTTAQKIVEEKFLKSGAWNTKNRKPQAFSVNFLYPIKDIMLRFSCDVGSVQRLNETVARQGIILNANYHVDVQNLQKSLNEANKNIARLPKHLTQFTDMTSEFFELDQNDNI